MKLCIFFLSLCFAFWAQAFPELVRHGYSNCISCHTSLSGGGLLNAYGRALSRELVTQPSFFGQPNAEGSEKIFGALELPENHLVGGDLRVLQTYIDDQQSTRGRFFVMQLAVEYSWQIWERLRAFGSVGRWESRKQNPEPKDYIYSPNYGLELLLTDPESDHRVTLKAGKFTPVYGINFQEHLIATRKILDFQPGQERTALEVGWLNESFTLVATGISLKHQGQDHQKENGGIVQIAVPVGEKSKMGYNFYSTNLKKFHGIFAHIAFSERTYGLFEANQTVAADHELGLVQAFKFGFEKHQGLHFVALQEFSNLSIKNANPKFEAFSVGAQWFPVTHWDLYGLLRKERSTALGNEFSDHVWLIGHYYL